MQIIIDYFLFVTDKLVNILNRLSFNGSYSILYYLLGAIIIGFIIKLVKGGSSEFEQNTNFLNHRIISSGIAKYGGSNDSRKDQIVKQFSSNPKKTYVRVNSSQAHLFGGKTRLTLDEYNSYVNDLNS